MPYDAGPACMQMAAGRDGDGRSHSAAGGGLPVPARRPALPQALFFIDHSLASVAFRGVWMAGGITYLFITSFTLLIDTSVGRVTWKEAVLFPGAVNVVILLGAIFPGPMNWLARQSLSAAGL